jgi:diguanylate cyclase (GGDEF)-like protein/PAS domain S-box-containing protein
MTQEPIDILLVEDNLGDAELLTEFLQEISSVWIEFTHTTHLAQALALLKQRSFQGVLLDLQLPDAQGLEALKSLQKQHRALPVIVLTGFNDFDLALEAVRSGAQDYLVKGQLDGHLLVRAIRYAIERKRAEATLRQQADRERLIATIAQHVRHSLELLDILTTAVLAMRQFLHIDRAFVYRLDNTTSGDANSNHANSNHANPGNPMGEVIVESVSAPWPSILGQQFSPDFFAEDSEREGYAQGCVQAISKAQPQKLSPIHHQFLNALTAQASLTVPIFEGELLWGLFVAQHCATPHEWQPWEIDCLRQLSIHLAIAIQQSELYQQAQSELAERKRVEAALRKSEQRLNSILSSLQDVVWSLSATTLEPLYLNSATEAIYGRSTAEFLENPKLWLEVVHPEDRFKILSQQELLLRKGSEAFEYRIIRPDKGVRWLYRRSQVTYDSHRTPLRIDSIETDITERKRMEEQLLHEACHDALTGLPNRTLFMDRLEQAIVRVKRYPFYQFAVLFLDLDRFKVVNDSLGHIVGDQLLVAITQRLKTCLRPTDTIARLGGDEFTILLDNIRGLEDAIQVVERIHEVLEQPFKLNNYEVFTSTSVGIVPVTANCDQPEEILRNADIVMYRAKEKGRGCHAVFDSAMHNTALNLLQLEIDLRRAIEQEELSLYYQPIVSLTTGAIMGFEALIRWQHPQRGMVSPIEFVPIAEETGLIIPIGWWILDRSCRQLYQWQQQFPLYQPLSISVNLSAKQFTQPDLVSQIDRILRHSCLDPQSLKLEITEGELMVDDEIVSSILARLKKIGIQLSIDDFGTGYSSLSRLHQLPINTLKIDRSFIQEILHNGDSTEIPKAIITLAHNLQMDVVAEGIETQEQLTQLQALACDYGQGYLFSAPIAVSEATRLLEAAPFPLFSVRDFERGVHPTLSP